MKTYTQIQHLMIYVDDEGSVSASINYADKPSAQDASELLLAVHLDVLCIKDSTGDELAVHLDAETIAELREIAEN